MHKGEKKEKTEHFQKMWDIVRKISLGEERKIEQNKIFEELRTNNFPNLIKDLNLQFQEVQKN